MDQAHQRQGQDHVLQPHGRDHVCAAAHQHGGKEIDEKRIGKAHAGKSRILRRQVVALRKAVDDLKMQWQIAKIVGDAGKDAVGMLKDGPAENHPQQNGQGKIENQSADISAFANLKQESASCLE